MSKTTLEDLQEFRDAWDELKAVIVIQIKKDISNLLKWIKRSQNENQTMERLL